MPKKQPKRRAYTPPSANDARTITLRSKQPKYGPPMRLKGGKIQHAAGLFLVHGAAAAARFLGPQFKELSPVVFARAKIYARTAARMELSSPV
jgi:hypothetical protein